MGLFAQLRAAYEQLLAAIRREASARNALAQELEEGLAAQREGEVMPEEAGNGIAAPARSPARKR
jgi:predicted transcriptional regulator